jgi:hypothetical protein
LVSLKYFLFFMGVKEMITDVELLVSHLETLDFLKDFQHVRWIFQENAAA